MLFRSKKEDPEDVRDQGPPDYKEGESEPIDSEQVDPFGDETNAGVKYRTMTWWYVLFDYLPQIPMSTKADLNMNSIRQAGMRKISSSVPLPSSPWYFR